VNGHGDEAKASFLTCFVFRVFRSHLRTADWTNDRLWPLQRLNGVAHQRIKRKVRVFLGGKSPKMENTNEGNRVDDCCREFRVCVLRPRVGYWQDDSLRDQQGLPVKHAMQHKRGVHRRSCDEKKLLLLIDLFLALRGKAARSQSPSRA
jgi:hypothetical protein